MRISIATLAIFASMAVHCAASALGGGDSSSPSKSLPNHLPVIFDQPTIDLSSTAFSSNGLEITNSYADDEDREWYESQYEAIGSAKELKEALLLCKDFYAMDPSAKSGVLERVLGYVAESEPNKPQIGHLSPMQVQVAVSCVNLDRNVGGVIKSTEEYRTYRTLIGQTSSVHCLVVLTSFRDQFVDIYYRGKDDGDAFTQIVQVAYRDLLRSAHILSAHDTDKNYDLGGPRNPTLGIGRMETEDMTPVQILLYGRLFMAFANAASNKPSTSSEKWNQELKRLFNILIFVTIAFCSVIAYICMNLEDYYKVGKKKRKKDKHQRRCRSALKGTWGTAHSVLGSGWTTA